MCLRWSNTNTASNTVQHCPTLSNTCPALSNTVKKQNTVQHCPTHVQHKHCPPLSQSHQQHCPTQTTITPTNTDHHSHQYTTNTQAKHNPHTANTTSLASEAEPSAARRRLLHKAGAGTFLHKPGWRPADVWDVSSLSDGCNSPSLVM